jgi:dTDP-4-amino-4,6-dideoxygalactose transaminase
VSTSPWRVPLADVSVDDELLDAVRDAVASGWWSTGPRVALFEAALADRFRVRHALAVANGTAALHLALLAAGCGPGDEVILPSLTFVAAANTVRHVGATPVFCDISGEDDLNLDPEDVRAAMGPRTKAVIVLHYGGHPCDIDRIVEIARAHGVTIIEDAAHAPGASLRGRPCGTLGDIGCFSFFSNKNLPIGEGGAVVTDDPALAKRVALLRSHGMTTTSWDREQGHANDYDVVLTGFNYRLDEIRAALGLVQLSRLDVANERRSRLVQHYWSSLAGVEQLVLPFARRQIGVSAHHLAVVLLPDRVARARVREALREVGVQTSVHYPPIHGFTAYRDISNRRPLPRTEAVAERLLSLPLFPEMTGDQLELVVAQLRQALAAELVA